MIDLSTEIRRRYGNVRRARGYYLYTEKNIRLLDLWLDGGKAILGRRSGQTHLVCKQFLDRGLTGMIPTKAEAQLERALRTVFPDYPVIRWYYSEEKALQIAQAAYQGGEQTIDRSHAPRGDHFVPVWRPFLGIDRWMTAGNNSCYSSGHPGKGTCRAGTSDTAAAAELAPLALVTPVYPMPCGIIAAEARFNELLPPSDALFPPLVYSLARAFFDFKRKEEEAATLNATVQHNIQKPSARKGAKRKRAALLQRAAVEKLLPALWTQKSCYLFPRIPRSEYAAVFAQALDAHVLISPDYDQPSLLPGYPGCGSCTELIKFLKARNT